jgi:hypothetical protein
MNGKRLDARKLGGKRFRIVRTILGTLAHFSSL